MMSAAEILSVDLLKQLTSLSVFKSQSLADFAFVMVSIVVNVCKEETST